MSSKHIQQDVCCLFPQELEAYVDDTDIDSDYKSDDFYYFSLEDRERQKREREESKRVLQELKSVLGFKASEAERQKWKQLLFSDHGKHYFYYLGKTFIYLSFDGSFVCYDQM